MRQQTRNKINGLSFFFYENKIPCEITIYDNSVLFKSKMLEILMYNNRCEYVVNFITVDGVKTEVFNRVDSLMKNIREYLGAN